MKKNIRSLFSLWLSVLIPFSLVCQRTTSPFLDNYDGIYSLDAEWLVPTDTFTVLKPYLINYTATGVDSFLAYKIESEPAGFIDTLLFRSTLTETQVSVLFTLPFIGYVKMIGVHQNYQQTEILLPVTVINPFKIEGITSANVGQVVTLSIKQFEKSDLIAQWYVDNGFTQEKPADQSFQITYDTALTRRVYAVIKNKLGHTVTTDTVDVVFSPQKPNVKILADSMEIPLNQETIIPVLVENADSIQWIAKNNDIATTTTGALRTTFAKIGKDTVIVTATNRFGLKSNPDTLYITVKSFDYTLQTVTFPDTIRARRWSSWQVQAIKNGKAVTDNSVLYEWKTIPDSAWDSLRLLGDGSQLQMFFKDSIAPLSISVRAKVGSDSTFRHQQSIITRTYIPSCVFLTTDISTTINVDVPLSVNAADANSDGGIAGIFYKTSDMLLPLSTSGENVWSVKFATPGQKLVKAWSVDNEGFTSDTAKTAVLVTANHPYFTRATIDTSIFINDSLRLVVQAEPGNSLDTIKSYRWDIDNSGSWSKTTQTGRVDLLYTTPGSRVIRVGCIDNRGDSGQAIINVNVLSGKPIVTKISPDTVYIHKNIQYKLWGTDPNGTVMQWAISWDTGLPFEVKSDSNFTHVYTTEGLKRTKSYVVDNDGISSDTISKDIFVKLGLPGVASINVSKSISQIYIKDSVVYTYKGSDPNDWIDSIFISWNGDTVFESRSKAKGDSVTVVYAFARADSGTKQIRVRVQDPDGLSNDSLFTLTVLSGAPILDSISPNQGLWVNDLNTYTIYGRDLNGTLDSFAVDWNGDDNWEYKKSRTFTHSFDTTKIGSRPVKVKIMDDDSVWTVASLPVNVRLGRPIVKGGGTYGNSKIQWVNGSNGGLDTMFYVWTSGQPTTVVVDTADTNGQSVRFYWDWTEAYISDGISTVPTIQRDMPENTVHKVTVNCKDDDSLNSLPYSFYVFPDAAPDTPVVFSGTRVGDTVSIEWVKTTDAKDLGNTQVQILIDYGISIEPTTPLFNSTLPKVSSFDTVSRSGTTMNLYKFKATQPGNGRWRVRLIDARGSSTTSADRGSF